MTTRTRKHWTQEDIQKLIALTEEGASNADIANQLDCTAHSLKNKKTQLRKAGILPPSQAEIEFSPEQLEEIRTSLMPNSALAKKFGCDPKVIAKRRMRMNINPTSPGQQCQYTGCYERKVNDPHRLGLCADHLANARRILAKPSPITMLGEEWPPNH